MLALNKDISIFLGAIIEFEGWHPPDNDKFPIGSRSYRNHNPGNLRASPFERAKVDGFSYFVNDNVGYMALQWDIMQKSKGNTVTGLNGNSTIEEFVNVWAPASDGNNPEQYIRHIEKRTGWPRTKTLGEIFR